MPLDQEWETLPDITMLGDAAHVMPPSAGEGVNMAMLDALELSQYLLTGEFEDVQSALAGYERQMHKRMAEVGKETMENTAWMQSGDALTIMLEFFNQIKNKQDKQ
jgi:2-polyprenyl-6-methoxyphenol hydroxylase-like FAD-dependent oxidoreductase